MIKKLRADVFYGPIDEVRMAQKINEIIDLLEEKFPEEVEPKLLPCPFCGEVPAYTANWEGHNPEYGVACTCPACHVQPKVTSSSGEVAVSKWNTRAEVKR